MARCLLALGSDLGDRPENLLRATRAVASWPNSRLLARSSWCETKPIGGPSRQGDFLNGSLLLETRLEPTELLGGLQEIERRLGRQRGVRWGARAIDVDLLLYDQRQIEMKGLMVPHPRMSFRRFVLQGACEIAGAMIHPASRWTLCQLLRHLDHAPRYVALATAEPGSAHRLAVELCRVLGCPSLEQFGLTSTMGPDSPPSEGVESEQQMAEMLRESRWRQTPELAARLPHGTDPALPPVVSSFWRHQVEPGLIRPAVVVAWEKSAPFEADVAWKQILDRPGHGPMARIQSDDFSAVLLEALAAVRAVWPSLPESAKNEPTRALVAPPKTSCRRPLRGR